MWPFCLLAKRCHPSRPRTRLIHGPRTPHTPDSTTPSLPLGHALALASGADQEHDASRPRLAFFVERPCPSLRQGAALYSWPCLV